MHFPSFAVAFAALFTLLVAPVVFANGPIPITVATYSDIYDDENMNLNAVACSNGPNGMETKGFTVIGAVPGFPFVGGIHWVSGWNSPKCGSCWKITRGDNSINMLAIDTSGVGVTLSKTAFLNLTNGEGLESGSVDVLTTPLDPSDCGF